MPITVQVTGVEELAKFLFEAPDKILREFHRRVGARQEDFLNGLRSTIQVVVYNAYQPTRYERNFKLWLAANKELERSADSVSFVLFNDTSRVRPTSPKGGSPPHEVPFEIEEGRWPMQWYGFTQARPAYSMYYASEIRPAINKIADDAVESVLTA